MAQDILDMPLFSWEAKDPENGHSRDSFSVRNACEGVLILGGLGSGKTSGSGAQLARHYLAHKFGGLVLTAKQDEIDLWRHYCNTTNREKDLIVFEPDQGLGFNFLRYEQERSDGGAGLAANIADTLVTVMKAGMPESSGQDSAFWDTGLQQLVVNAIELCLLANRPLDFADIYAVVQSAPRDRDDLKDPDWQWDSKFWWLLRKAISHLRRAEDPPSDEEFERDRRRIALVEDFFFGNWLNLAERTKSIIEQMFFAFGDRLNREPLHSLFCGEHNISPEDTMNEGKVIVLGLPYLSYDAVGRDAQILFKFLWQRAMQRRDIKRSPRPVFLWADEAHYFLHRHDVDFQSTIRSYRGCTVYLTQNIPNFRLHSEGKGTAAMDRFKALVGNLGTKIFHANTDNDTNQYAADQLGKAMQWKRNRNEQIGSDFHRTEGEAEDLRYILEPSSFGSQRTGGPANEFIVEAVVLRQGAKFSDSKRNFTTIYFKQNFQ